MKKILMLKNRFSLHWSDTIQDKLLSNQNLNFLDKFIMLLHLKLKNTVNSKLSFFINESVKLITKCYFAMNIESGLFPNIKINIKDLVNLADWNYFLSTLN